MGVHQKRFFIKIKKILRQSTWRKSNKPKRGTARLSKAWGTNGGSLSGGWAATQQQHKDAPKSNS